MRIAENFNSGERYNIGGGFEINNLDLAYLILSMMGKPRSLVEFVQDRKGHDLRYSMDSSKLRDTLWWEPKVKFGEGLEKTLEFYNA